MEKADHQSREVFSVIRDLARVTRLYQRDSTFCKGVTFVQFNILDLLAEHNGIELSDMHGILEVDKSTTTRLLDPLVNQGLILRLNSSRDTRATRLELTEKGRTMHAELWQCLNESMDQILKNIPSDKREEVMVSVRLFVRAIHGCCCGDR